MLHTCCDLMRQQGLNWLLAEYRPSQRNEMAASFLPEHGFTLLNEASADIRTESREILEEVNPDSTLYIADLTTLTLPHMEIFAHDIPY